ncbi:MAG TPA: hypothetical protein VGU20_18115 [Stellaceae bacterium]|nr:hypothetical protein [Stellaceae bacterium]
MSDTKQQALIIYDEATHGKLGPAMKALGTDKQRAFVIALVKLGCTVRRAAQLAGYADNPNSLDCRGYQLSHDPKIQAALQEEGVKALRTSGVAAISVLEEIMRNPQSADRDRISAAKEVLGRGGFASLSEHNINITHRSEAELDAEMEAVGRELGWSEEQIAKAVGRKVKKKRSDEAIDVTEEVTIIEAEPQPRAPCQVCGKTHPDHVPDCGTSLAREQGQVTDENPEPLSSSPATGGEASDEAEDISDLF